MSKDAHQKSDEEESECILPAENVGVEVSVLRAVIAASISVDERGANAEVGNSTETIAFAS